ncbi:MAG: MFS transporter [Thermoanaerobaculales bacterium]
MKEHRSTIGIVFLIVFIDLVGFGIVIPILPLYAEEFGPSPVVFGLLMASFSIMQFVAAPILGQGIAYPSLSALTSKLAGPDEVGGVMGVYQSMSSLGRIVGPFWAEIAYGRIGFAWPFRTGSVFMLAACLVAVVTMAQLRRRNAGFHGSPP